MARNAWGLLLCKLGMLIAAKLFCNPSLDWCRSFDMHDSDLSHVLMDCMDWWQCHSADEIHIVLYSLQHVCMSDVELARFYFGLWWWALGYCWMFTWFYRQCFTLWLIGTTLIMICECALLLTAQLDFALPCCLMSWLVCVAWVNCRLLLIAGLVWALWWTLQNVQVDSFVVHILVRLSWFVIA